MSILLLVDDDKSLLETFQKLFVDSNLKIVCVTTSDQGRQILQSEPVDLLITHFRMHKGDGIQFLKKVRQHFPEVFRVLTSGFLDPTLVFKFINSGLVSAFIPKPWDQGLLKEKIIHVVEIKKILQEKSLLDLINTIEELPSLPFLFQELLRAIEENRAMPELAQVVSKDSAVATKVLHVVNSALFGRQDIADLDEAVVYLGESVLKDIVLTTTLIDGSKWSPDALEHLRDITFHSFMVNKYIPQVFRIVTGKSFSRHDPSIGIVHDIGKLILLKYFPDRYQMILDRSAGGDFHQAEIELGYEGCSHTEIGAYFLDWWNFPQVMVEGALFHHTPEKAFSEFQPLFKVAQYTDKLVSHVLAKPKDYDLSRFYVKSLESKAVDALAESIVHTAQENIIDRLI